MRPPLIEVRSRVNKSLPLLWITIAAGPRCLLVFIKSLSNECSIYQSDVGAVVVFTINLPSSNCKRKEINQMSLKKKKLLDLVYFQNTRFFVHLVTRCLSQKIAKLSVHCLWWPSLGLEVVRFILLFSCHLICSQKGRCGNTCDRILVPIRATFPLELFLTLSLARFWRLSFSLFPFARFFARFLRLSFSSCDGSLLGTWSSGAPTFYLSTFYVCARWPPYSRRSRPW